MGKKLDSINEAKGIFEEYFKEDLTAIEEELDKSKKYSDIIDNEIKKLSSVTLGSNKGSQHYLIEHITNAVQLQTQRQGLRRDRFNIKKAIMDYSAKFSDAPEEKTDNMADLINKLLEADKNKNSANKTVKSEESIDSEIDEILDRGNN